MLDKKWLFENVIWEKYLTDDPSQISYDQPITIENVRVERDDVVEDEKEGQVSHRFSSNSNILFVDLDNSVFPSTDIFVLESRVTYEDNVYKVKKIEWQKTATKFNHLEITLS